MNDPSTYSRLRERLEEIVVQVRSRDIPLEKSLDLYEEALRLGSRCAELIDRTDFSTEELESISEEAVIHSHNESVSVEAVVQSDEGSGDDDSEPDDANTAEGTAESR